MTRRDSNMTQAAPKPVGLDLIDLILLEVLMALIDSTAGECLIGQGIRSLPSPTSGMLAQLIDSSVSADKVAAAMNGDGIPGSASLIRQHRRGECVCNLTKGNA